MSNKSVLEIPSLVQDLYSIVDRLEELFPGRRFTPDGHLVGSIGEVLAAAGKLQKTGQRRDRGRENSPVYVRLCLTTPGRRPDTSVSPPLPADGGTGLKIEGEEREGKGPASLHCAG